MTVKMPARARPPRHFPNTNDTKQTFPLKPPIQPTTLQSRPRFSHLLTNISQLSFPVMPCCQSKEGNRSSCLSAAFRIAPTRAETSAARKGAHRGQRADPQCATPSTANLWPPPSTATARKPIAAVSAPGSPQAPTLARTSLAYKAALAALANRHF